MNTKTKTHTPTPWVVYDDGHDVGASDIIRGYVKEEAFDICEMMTNDLTLDIQRANAAFIVRAVNAHDGLVEALRKAADRVKHRSLTFSGERREFVLEVEAALKAANEVPFGSPNAGEE